MYLNPQIHTSQDTFVIWDYMYPNMYLGTSIPHVSLRMYPRTTADDTFIPHISLINLACMMHVSCMYHRTSADTCIPHVSRMYLECIPYVSFMYLDSWTSHNIWPSFLNKNTTQSRKGRHLRARDAGSLEHEWWAAHRGAPAPPSVFVVGVLHSYCLIHNLHVARSSRAVGI